MTLAARLTVFVLAAAVPIPLQGQVLISAYGGAARTSPAEVQVEQASLGTALRFPEVPFRGESFEPPIYYGYRLAARVPPSRWMHIEAELIHAKVFAEIADALPGTGYYRAAEAIAIPFGNVFEHFAMSHGLNFVLANWLLRTPLTTDRRWRLTARVGAGPMIPHREVLMDGHREEGYQLAGVGAQAAAGIERTLWKNVSGLAEYKMTVSRVRVSVHQGTARLTTRAHHLAVGVGVALGAR